MSLGLITKHYNISRELHHVEMAIGDHIPERVRVSGKFAELGCSYCGQIKNANRGF